MDTKRDMKQRTHRGKIAKSTKSKSDNVKHTPGLKEVITEILIHQDIRQPFKFLFDRKSPFTDPHRAEIFHSLILDVYNLRVAFSQPILQYGEKEKRDKRIKELKTKAKEISKSFLKLIPRKSKKNLTLVGFRKEPKLLLSLVDRLRAKLNGYEEFKKSYKGKPGKDTKNDIKQFWESEFKIPYPKRIYMDDRSDTTIVLSIISYWLACRYRDLSYIYSEARKRRKEKQASKRTL